MVFFVSVGGERDEIVLFFKCDILAQWSEKSPSEPQWDSRTMMSAHMGWAPASMRNMKRYIRGTYIFRGKKVTDKCTEIIAQFRKEHVGAGWIWVLDGVLKAADLGRPRCLRGGWERAMKWLGKWVLIKLPGRKWGLGGLGRRFMEGRKHFQKEPVIWLPCTQLSPLLEGSAVWNRFFNTGGYQVALPWTWSAQSWCGECW